MYFDIRKPETTNKTFRLPSELLHKLEKVAQQKGVSLNYLMGWMFLLSMSWSLKS